MTYNEFNSFCKSLPATTHVVQWGGAHVWKVGGKIFAVTSDQGTVVKTDSLETATLVIEMGRAIRAPYFHASWILVPHGRVPDDELTERIATSYALIRASLPKKMQAALE